MPHLGLTGGIGSGKSTVATMFEEKGAVIIDADAISRELMEPGQETLKKVVAVFGEKILHKDGHLNRAQLATLIFSDSTQRETLNSIVHPAVRHRAQELRKVALETQGKDAVIIEDIPLLTETGQASRFDGVIVVYADEAVRLNRLISSRGLSESDAISRMKAQATDDERARIATWIIDNSGELNETEHQVDKILRLVQANT